MEQNQPAMRPEAHHDDMNIVEHGVHHVHSSKKEIWKVFFILLCITLLEFLVALTPSIRGGLGKTGVILVFFGMTVLKAFYIVGYFMHLKHERMNMIYTILLPMIFILYLIALLMFEGSGFGGNY